MNYSNFLLFFFRFEKLQMNAAAAAEKIHPYNLWFCFIVLLDWKLGWLGNVGVRG